MSMDDGGLSRFEHDELRDLVLAGTQSIRPEDTRRGRFVGAAVALLLAGSLVGGVVTSTLRQPGSPAMVLATPGLGATVWSGWVAFSAGERDGDVYLAKHGSPARRILGSDTDNTDQVCPAFSPDGTRLASGQGTSDGAGRMDAALLITRLTADGEPSQSTTVALEGLVNPPCPVWSADGRWLAFRAHVRGETDVGEVWVVDSETNAIRRLTDLPATDLEWSPIGSDLFIASLGITVYSTATEEARLVPETIGAVALSVSPDGRAMAVQYDPSGTANGPVDLLLMGVDGSDRRTLMSGYRVGYGIGPVWSPDGNWVAFQRLCDTYRDNSGTYRGCLEEHDVVVVSVTDENQRAPFGSRTVIVAPQTNSGGTQTQWFPYSVSWAPDSMTLLYVAWSAGGSGVLAVPMDNTLPVVLDDALDVAGTHGGEPWNTFQSWSRRP